jgi:hypothetical protein
MNCYAKEWRDFVRAFHPALYDAGMSSGAFKPKPKDDGDPRDVVEWLQDHMRHHPGRRAYRGDMLARASADLGQPNLTGKVLIAAFRRFAPDATDGDSRRGRFFIDWEIEP